ncbi:MAG TPA: fibronectin type III domain-containing protein, partial [Solirubrobacteraceae bacterium]|nr:fibronectin type III domain-containing protein [Solirubrobacteraceae bacterium]
VTGSATSIAQTTATLNASVNPNGVSVSSCQFEYGTTEAYGSTSACSPAPGSGTSPVPVSASLAALAANTNYHFRISATGPGGTRHGSDATFSTLPLAPQANVRTATEITASAATLRGEVDPRGTAVTSCVLEYGPTTSYGSAAECSPPPGGGSGFVLVSARVTGLAHGTHYHYRVSATNAGGTVQSGDQQFETRAAEVAILSTPTVEEATPTSASFSGTVNPSGTEVTSCVFAYAATGGGTSLRTPCEPAEPGSGETPVPVHAHVSDLTPGVNYFVQLQVKNASGSTFSNVGEFTTPKITPIFGRCVKSTDGHAAFSNASCTTHGNPNKYEFAAGPGPNPGFTVALKTGTFILEGAVKTAKVVCTHVAGSGEVTGLQTVGLGITLTGCESNAHSCNTAGHAAGEVALSGLTGTLGLIALGTTATANKLGLTLSGAAEFECNGGAVAVSLGGTAIGSIAPTNTMKTIRTWKFTHSKQLEKPERFEGGPPQQLTWTFGGEGPAQVGLGTTLAFTTAEAVEISSVI